MTAINLTDLANAKLDADHLGELLNVADPAALTATDRNGHAKRTWAGKLADIDVAVSEEISGVVQARNDAEGFAAAAATHEASAAAVAAALPTNLGRIFSTYAELAAVSGLSNGTPGEVTADAGTHTDPVVGGTVSNTGRFEYSTSPAGWKRVGDNDVTTLKAAANVQYDEVEEVGGDGTIKLIGPTDGGDPALAFDPAEETLFGSSIDNLGIRPFEPSRDFAARLSKAPTVFTAGQGWHHVPVVGSQSNGGGSGDGDPVVSPTQAYSNLTFVGGLRADGSAGSWASTKALIEEVPAGSANSETVISGATEYINKYLAIKHGITPDKFLQFGAVAAQGATGLAGLDKPSTVYQLGLDQMSAAKTLATAAGKLFSAPAGFMLQGETDFSPTPTGRSVYSGLLNRVSVDLNTDVKVITGLADDFHLIVAQLSYGASTTLANNIALAQMDVFKSNPLVHPSHATYAFQHDDDDTHRTVLARKVEGAVMGRAYVQVAYEQREPDVLKPLGAFYDGTYVYIRFRVPRYPMVADITSLQKVTDYGLKIVDDTGTLTLSEHRILRGDTFVVRPNRALDANPRYRLGIDYLAWNLGASSAGIFNGAMTNLRDSSGYLGDTLNQITITYRGVTKTYRMPHWCLHDEGAITKLAS